MLAPFLQQELGDEFEVESAGVWEKMEGRAVNKFSVQCMREYGFDISGRKSRWIGTLDLTQFSHIVCVNFQVADAIRQMIPEDCTVLISEGFDNPNLCGREFVAYQEYANSMEENVPGLAKTIRET